jgi:hypothetical protein
MGLLFKLSRFYKETKIVAKEIIVNIWLDSLDELFSDFDPKSCLNRTVSNDFILQIQRVVAHQQGKK